MSGDLRVPFVPRSVEIQAEPVRTVGIGSVSVAIGPMSLHGVFHMGAETDAPEIDARVGLTADERDTIMGIIDAAAARRWARLSEAFKDF